jgi:iron complex outermembrane receptor protein
MAYSFPKQGTKIRAHVGNGFRSPSLYERYGTSYYLGSFSNYGDPRLSPERMISVDGGIDQYLLGGRLRLRGTYFYTRIQQAIMFDSSGVITPATDPFGRFGGYRNTGGGLARGFEGGVDAMVNKTLTVNGTYTYTNALERTTSLISGTLRSPRVFEHMFTAGAVQRIGRRTDVTFNLLAASNYMYPISSGGSRAFLFKGPLKADVTANYTLPVSEHRNIRFYMRAENILDRTRYEDGFITPGFWAVGGLKFLF